MFTTSHVPTKITIMSQSSLKLSKKFRPLKGFHWLRYSDFPPTTPAIARAEASVIVRIWPLLKIVTRVSSHQEYLKWTMNSRYQLAHIQLWGERALGLALSSHSSSRKGHRPLLFQTSATVRLLPDIGSSQRLPLHTRHSSATEFSGSRR